VHGYIKFVAIGILQVQEFGRDATDFESNQAEVSPDAIFRVDDRRSFLQVIKLPDDGFRVTVMTAFAAARPGALTE